MLLRQLEYLRALSHEGHFGRAAQACHVTQPALSAGIRKLEAELDVQIVQRGQRFEGLTEEGEQILTWAQRIIADVDAMRHQLAAMREGLSGVLRIGAIPTALTVASLLTARLRERHSLVRYSLESMSSREIVHRLAEFDIDVGMTYVDGEPLGSVRTVPLYRERYLLLTPREGELGGRDSVGWSEVAELPLCLLSPVMQNRRILNRYFAEAGTAVDPIMETDTVSAIFAHVDAMRLSSVIPHAWLHRFGIPPGMHVIPLPRPKQSFHVGLVLNDRDPQPMVASAVVDVAHQVDMVAELDATMRQYITAPRQR